MNRLFIIPFLFFFFFFQFVPVINSQGIAGIPIPGVDCGNSNSTSSSAQLCCKKVDFEQKNDISELLKILKNYTGPLGFLVTFFNDMNIRISQLTQSANIVPCPIGYPSDPASPSCTCISADKITPSPLTQVKSLCKRYLLSSKEQGDCESCAQASGIWTAAGCIYGDAGLFIQHTLFGWGIGLAGITALLCMIYGSLMMQTSRGNAEKIKKAQELITSCVMGLMLIIFSVLILRIIGIDILKIPGFK